MVFFQRCNFCKASVQSLARDGQALSNIDLVGVADVVSRLDLGDSRVVTSRNAREGITRLDDVGLRSASRRTRSGGRRRVRRGRRTTTAVGDAALGSLVKGNTSLLYHEKVRRRLAGGERGELKICFEKMIDLRTARPLVPPLMVRVQAVTSPASEHLFKLKSWNKFLLVQLNLKVIVAKICRFKVEMINVLVGLPEPTSSLEGPLLLGNQGGVVHEVLATLPEAK